MARAARTYRKVEPAMWHADSFRKLSAPKPNGQTLWTYLITGPRTIAIPGVVVARPAVMADDLRWSRRGFDAAMAEIVAAGMAEVDPEAGLVVLTNALIHDGKPRDTAYPNGGNAIKSWVTALLNLPSCALRDSLSSRLAHFASLLGGEMSNAFADAMGRPFPMVGADHPPTIPDGVPDGVGTQDQDIEQEQEQEQKRESVPAAPGASPATEPLKLEPTGKRQRKARASNPETTMPDDFAPSDAHRARAAELGVDADQQFRLFRAHHGSKGNLFRNWSMALDKWIEGADRFQRAGPVGSGTRTPGSTGHDATAEALRRRGFIP